MTDTELRELLDAARTLLKPHLDRSPPLRTVCTLLGRLLIEAAQESTDRSGAAPVDQATPPPAPAAPPSPPSRVPSPFPPAPAARPAPAPPSTPALPLSYATLPLKLGGAVAHVVSPGTTVEFGRARQAAYEPASGMPEPEERAARDIDLELIVKRCRLKAKSCRRLAAYIAAEGAFISDPDRRAERERLIDEAKQLPDCFLWVFYPGKDQPPEPELLMIADCYDAQAEAAMLMRDVDALPVPRPDRVEADAMRLLAEANSMLRAALSGTWLTKDDVDQLEIHQWLRHQTALRKIYIAEYMSLDRTADPAAAPDLRRRLAEASRRLADLLSRDKRIKSLLNKIRYEIDHLSPTEPDEIPARRAKIARAVVELQHDGVPPADRRIASVISPRAELLNTFAADDALTPILERFAAESSADDAEGPAARELSADVARVRSLLEGKRMVVIGGEPRPHAIERFKEAFRLGEVEWVPLVEHGPSQPMLAPIARADTALVLVIIKLAGHLHVDDARAAAEAAGKPLIVLPSGYNPQRVAHEILQQASERIEAAVNPPL